MNASLPTTTAERKQIPLARGLLDYFPAALAEVARLSQRGNDKHNPGEDLHWARGKSMDHADCILRHLVDRGTIDPEDGVLHDAKIAWRALALLQERLEKDGAPMPRGARLTATTPGCDCHQYGNQVCDVCCGTAGPVLDKKTYVCPCGNTTEWTYVSPASRDRYIDQNGGPMCSDGRCIGVMVAR